MNQRLETWTPVGGVLKRRGRSTTIDRSTLVIGVDEPDETTTGLLPDITLTVVNGDVSLSTPGQVYENKDIFGRVSVSAANVTIRNCRIRGGSSPSTGLITLTSASVSNCVIEDCLITPDYPHSDWNGVVGHDFTLRRCNIWGTTDGLNIHNTHATQPYDTNVIVEQCYIHDLSWWTAPTGGIVHPSDTETHNDLIQHMGGRGTIIRGNRLDAYFARQFGHWYVTGDPHTEPYTTVPLHSLPDGGPYQPIPNRGNGNEATGRYNYDDLSAIMIGDEVDNTTELLVTDNWMRGGNFTVNGGGNPNPGGGVSLGSFLRNRFSRDQGNQGSGGDTTQTLNFQGGSWAGFVTAPTSGADMNYYEDNGHAITVRT
jgi:hypothetical protein